jgi:AAA family ATP:ADP antiporter
MQTQNSKSPIERFLSIFSEVKSGEGFSALFLMFNIFLILTSYYIMKPVREALILAGGTAGITGAVIKSYTAAGQVILLMFAVPMYSYIAGRIPRRRLINVVTIFFAACLAVFYMLALSKVPIGIIFFLWIGIFNLMIPAQFWAFANDVYTPEGGKRIFVIIAFGASAGAVSGGVITDVLIEPLGIYQLLLVAGTLLLLSLILTNIVEAREKTTHEVQTTAKEDKEPEPIDKSGAFRLVFKSKYLLMIAFLMMFLNWVNTTGEFILGQTVENTAKGNVSKSEVQRSAENFALKQLKTDMPNGRGSKSATSIEELEGRNKEKAQKYVREFNSQYIKQFIGSFYAKFYTVVNLAGLLMQLFLVSRILKYLGVRVALLILPFIALSGYFLMAFFPVLSIIRWAKTAENSTDYSLQNTVRQVLFLPTTREEKYKAKQAIDTFFWRAGDLLSTALVGIGTTWLAFQTRQFAMVNIVLVIIWIVLAIFIGIENHRRTSSTVSEN